MDCSEAGKVRMMATKTHRTEVTRDLPLMVICAPEQSCPIVWHFNPEDKSNHVFLNMWTSDIHTICTCRKQNQVKKPDVEGLQLRRRKDVPWNRSQPWSAIVWIRRKLQTWKKMEKWKKKNGKMWKNVDSVTEVPPSSVLHYLRKTLRGLAAKENEIFAQSWLHSMSNGSISEKYHDLKQ